MNEPIGRLRILESGAGAAHGLGDRVDRLFLADDPLVQRLFHLEQPLGLFLGDAHHRDAGPHRDDLRDVFFGHVRALVPCCVLPAPAPGPRCGRAACARGRAARPPARIPGRDRGLLLALQRLQSAHRLLEVGGAAERCMRTRDDASSIRSIALSGMKRSVT